MTQEVTKIDPKAPAVQHAITPMEMLSIAVERGADLDQLTKLMDLQERWEANEARKAFVEALNAFKADPPVIARTKKASFVSKRTGGLTEYDYATLDKVSDIIGKALAEHGLSHSWRTDQSDDQAIRVTCILRHRLGHSEEVTMRAMPDDSGGKNLIQQIGSTVSYLERYTLLAATGLAAADQDDDGATGGATPIDAEQKEQIIALIKETGADTAKLCKYFGVENIDQLAAAQFDAVIQALEQKRQKGGAK